MQNVFEMQNVFVYGTLKRGQLRQRSMSGQSFIRTAFTVADYQMYRLEDYPGLISTPGTGDRISGEVYRIDAAGRRLLDVIECVESGLYELKQIQLERCDDLAPVFAYFYLGDVQGCERLSRWPPSGDRGWDAQR